MFPVDLSYASSGLKVHETPSSVGLGWVLNGTGVVNRQVRGVPDEQNHGYNGLQPTATVVQSIANGGYSPTSPYAAITQRNFQKGIGQTDYDGEPDLFNFSFAGHGGKFFFDETQVGSNIKNAVMIPKMPVSVSANFNYAATQLFNPLNTSGRIDVITMYDEKGVKYIFGQREGALLNDDDYQYGKNIVNAWFLTRIVTPNGNTLDFTYTQQTIDLPHAQSEYRFLYESIPTTGGGLDYASHLTVSQSQITETVLQEISINNGTWGKIQFIENTADRADWSFSASGTKPKSLKEVVLRDGSNTIVKKFAFTYDSNIINRLLLRSVQEFGTAGTVGNEPYQFEYFNETDIPVLPQTGNTVITREDHWGYYNANSSGTLLPDYQVVITNLAGKKDTLSPKEYDKLVDTLTTSFKNVSLENQQSIITTLSTNTYYVTGTNRNPDFNSALIGQLKKITYPSKASTEFVYEANSYFGPQSQTFNPCSGNYQSITNVSETQAAVCGSISSNFTIASGAFACMKVLWNINIQSQNQGEVIGDVLLVNTGGTQFFSRIVRGVNSPTVIHDVGAEYIVLPPGDYTMTATVCGENATANNISSAILDLQGVPPTDNNYVTRESGGVRIKEMKDCPISGSTVGCLTKEYEYTNPTNVNNSSGRIVTNGVYAYTVQYVNVNAIINALYLNSASQLPLATTQGHYIGYDFVTVRDVMLDANNSKVYKGKTTFDYLCPDISEVPDLASFYFPFWSISKDWQRGVVEQNVVYDQTGDWLKDLQNGYVLKSSLDYSKVTSLKAGKFIHNVESATNGYDPDIYLLSPYRSITGFQYSNGNTQKE